MDRHRPTAIERHPSLHRSVTHHHHHSEFTPYFVSILQCRAERRLLKNSTTTPTFLSRIDLCLTRACAALSSQSSQMKTSQTKTSPLSIILPQARRRLRSYSSKHPYQSTGRGMSQISLLIRSAFAFRVLPLELISVSCPFALFTTLTEGGRVSIPSTLMRSGLMGRGRGAYRAQRASGGRLVGTSQRLRPGWAWAHSTR